VFLSATSRTVYLDGVAGTTNTTNRTVGTTNTIALGSDSAQNVFFDGQVAEVAVWNTDLTTSEIASLAKGFSPLHVRRQNLRIYAPLVASTQEILQASSFSATFGSPTLFVHPRVIRPRRRLIVPKTAGGAVNLTAPLISSGSIIRTPTISLGNIAVTAPKISTASVLRDHATQLQVTAPKINSASAFHNATVTEVLTVTAPKLASASVLRTHSVSEVLTVTAPLLASASVLRAHATQLSLTAPKLASASVLRDHTVSEVISLTAPLLASGSVLRAHSVSLTFTVTAPLKTSTSAFHNATVSVDQGAVSLDAPKLASTSTLRAHSTALQITAPKLASVGVLQAHTTTLAVTLTAPKLASGSVLRDHTVSNGAALAAPLLTSAGVLRAHTVSLSLTAATPLLVSTSALYAPVITVDEAAQEVAANRPTGSGVRGVRAKTLPYGWWEETNAPEQEIAAAQEAVKAVRAELRADEEIQPQTAEALRSALWFADIDAKLSRITGERQLKAIEKQIAQAKAEYDRAMAEAAEREDEEDVELLLLSSL
jgi:hypothetical protein